jgi:hypothetical protein
LVLRLLRAGALDLEATEMALREGMHQLGARLLEKLLEVDAQPLDSKSVDCGQGHAVSWLGWRPKQLLTVLGPIQIRRSYYYCEVCRTGVHWQDSQWDIEGTGLSPGVRRMMARLGSKEPFEEAREDLAELAGLQVVTKQVERVSEQLGQAVQGWTAAAAADLKPGTKFYIAYDGTGVPVVRRETEGRPGKQGPAKTREAKLGCLFSQTRLDTEGRPERDPDSTSYVGSIETAEAFGWHLYAEAERRGLAQAGEVIVLGDGAPWVWNLAEEHFPTAVQIVDLYHARQHLAQAARLIFGSASEPQTQWLRVWTEELDAGRIEAVIAALGRSRSLDSAQQAALEREVNYFRNNAERMRYDDFRQRQLFVGSGVVEAGCKTVIGQRLKRSGMHWTVRGANAIIALRCLILSGHWETFWESRSAA